jgi:hypothetical protein
MVEKQKCLPDPHVVEFPDEIPTREHREWESFGRKSGTEEPDKYPIPLANIRSSDPQFVIRTLEFFDRFRDRLSKVIAKDPA